MIIQNNFNSNDVNPLKDYKSVRDKIDNENVLTKEEKEIKNENMDSDDTLDKEDKWSFFK